MSAKLQMPVVIIKNDKGEVLEVKEVQTLNEDRINELKKQAQENSARYNTFKVSQEEAREKEIKALESEIELLRKALVEIIFKDEVERGFYGEDDEERQNEIYGGLKQ